MTETQRDSFERVLEEQALRHPAMEPRDWAKLAYQSEFGPEHLIGRAEDVLPGIRRERSGLGAGAPTPPEAIGNGLCRFSLDNLTDERSEALLSGLFFRTARECAGTQAGLLERLALIERLHPDCGAWFEEYRSAGCPPVSHSARYHAAYAPHYRLLREEYACHFSALAAVARLTERGRSAIIAIDGRCGSGKSALADLIGRLFPCNVFHMDDYYLPFTQRAPDWEQRVAGNMDLERFLTEILRLAGTGAELLSRPYDCQQGDFLPLRRFAPRRLTVVEGSYSHHPALAQYYDLTIFLTCDAAVQCRRLRAREGDHFRSFEERWIPMEERYFKACSIQETSDLVIDTGTYFDLNA